MAECFSRLEGAVNALCRDMHAYCRPGRYEVLEGDIAQDELASRAWTQSAEPIPYTRGDGVKWFRFHIEVPKSIMGLPTAGMQLRLQSLFFAPVSIYIDGELRLSETAWMDFKSPEVILSQSLADGSAYTVEARFELGSKTYWNGGFGLQVAYDGLENVEFDCKTALQELRNVAELSQFSARIPALCDALARDIESGDLPTVQSGIGRLHAQLEPARSAMKSRTVNLIGHAHIDMNWFWPMEETERVVGRDFATMLKLMDETPDFRFSQSQCVTYQIAQRLFPETFERVKAAQRRGQWDITASTWVEGDLNMACGESIVRHILYSNEYLQKHFGFAPRIMWCPDTFGHSANLPQILKKANIDYYFFTRCGIGVDYLPYEGNENLLHVSHTPVFRWEGMDGSSVVACNMSYNYDVEAGTVSGIADWMHTKLGSAESMVVYGTGDHGGGPTRRDMQRMKKLNAYPGIPSLRYAGATEALDRIQGAVQTDLTLHRGEMNFIFDGCYTSHADIKRYNRECENALLAAEALDTLQALCARGGCASEPLHEAWEKALFNQFHDILDGSGVAETYLYSRRLRDEVLETAGQIAQQAAAVLTDGAEDCLTVFNPLCWPRSELVRLPDTGSCSLTDAQGNHLPVAEYGGQLYARVEGIPAFGAVTLTLKKEAQAPPEGKSIADRDGVFAFETDVFKVEVLKRSGEIVTLYDKEAEKYVVRRAMIGWRLKNGALNTLLVAREEPTHMSSWTVGDIQSTDTLRNAVSAEIVCDNALVKQLRFVHRYGDSVITQDMVFPMASRRIDFQTEADWQEHGWLDRPSPMLTAAFTPDIADGEAYYEIPFGAVRRPGMDKQYPALKWADLSNGAYGLAILNNCKHGHKINGNRMELALIRSSWMPDDRSDIGRHAFTYSLYPHAGDWRAADVTREAFCLNIPVRTAAGRLNNGVNGMVEPQENGHVRVAALKEARNGRGVCLRIAEYAGRAGTYEIRFGRSIAAARLTNLIETGDTQDAAYAGRSVTVAVKPFDIVTLIVEFQP